MADVKISQLSLATLPLAETEVLPIVQNGTTKQVSVANLTAGRTVNTGNLTVYDATTAQVSFKPGAAVQGYINSSSAYMTLSHPFGGGLQILDGGSAQKFEFLGGNLSIKNGNLILGTSGKGIDFSATGQAGGMTSELLADYEEGTWTPGQGAGLTVVGAFSSAGKYTKIGRAVTLTGYIAGSTSVAFAANADIVTGIPYTTDTANGKPVGVGANATNSAISGIEATNTSLNGVVALAATTRFDFTITYTV